MKTQNANFASKVWALDFRQAEDPECKLFIQGLGLEFLGRQKTQNANFASKVWAWILGRQKTQNANFASKVSALDFRQAEDPECKLCIQGLGLEF